MEEISSDKENGSTSATNRISASILAFMKKLQKFVIANFIACSFSVAIIFALSYDVPGAFLGSFLLYKKGIIQFINTFIVFLISGLTLKIEEFRDVSKYSKAIIFGVFSINFLTTLVAPIFLSCSFLSPSYRLGLAIFCCVPTTLGVGVALTQLSKGDVLLGLSLTVLTNALGVATTPFLLIFYVSQVSNGNGDLTFDSVGLLVNLALDVLLPSIIGVLCRYLFSSTIVKFTKDYKTEISMFSTLNLTMIIWMTLSKSRPLLLKQSIGDIFIILLCVVLMHVFYLIGHYTLTRKQLLNFEISQAITMIIMCSQKSNPVALAVINGMGMSSTKSGLAIIPGLLGQLTQIFIGSVLVRYFQKLHKSEEEKQQAATPDGQLDYGPCETNEIEETNKEQDAEVEMLTIGANSNVESDLQLESIEADLRL